MAGSSSNYDRLKELKAFDDSKSGVKGLMDAGITKVPRIFIRPPEEIASDEALYGQSNQTQFKIPVVDLKDIAGDRSEVVAGVRKAAETVGIFQVVNHGIHMKLLKEMLEVARGFHELPSELKTKYYSREPMKKVQYRSNYDLYSSKFANWRDSLFCIMSPEPPDPLELPQICR